MTSSDPDAVEVMGLVGPTLSGFLRFPLDGSHLAVDVVDATLELLRYIAHGWVLAEEKV